MYETIVRELGIMVISAGLLEHSVRNAILSFANKETGKLIYSLLLPSNTISTNIDILNRIVNAEVNSENREEWKSCISDLNTLFSFRNQIFHSMYGVMEENVYFFHVKKGKKGAADTFKEELLNLEELKKNNNNFSSRHRQLMDFIENSRNENEESHIKTQNNYGQLKK